MGNLLEHVETSLRTRRLFRRGQRILVAVSGGLDSMVLLHVLLGLSKKQDWQLTVAHFNHRLRGRSSDADEKLVRQAARRLRLPIVAERGNVLAIAAKEKLSTEMSARKLRHEFLARAARGLKTPAVALAHHADDQLELFFLRLLRGSGSEGLAGMRWRNASPADPKVDLIRPLLDIAKATLKEYAAENRLRFREDASNACQDIQRNRIRHELLPLLRRRYQPALDRTVSRVMEIVGADAEFVTRAAESWLESMPPQTPQHAHGTSFEALPLALQRRCIQLQLLRQGVPPDFEVIEHLRKNADRPMNLPGMGPLTIFRNAGGLIALRHLEKAAFTGAPRLVEIRSGIGGTVLDGVRFTWQINARKGSQRPSTHPGREFFDADRVGSAVFLRHWLPGDKFQPIGMPRAVKLQDLLTNLKVPRQRRHELALATTAQGEVFWVEGMRISERFKLTKSTIRRLQWGWRRL